MDEVFINIYIYILKIIVDISRLKKEKNSNKA